VFRVVIPARYGSSRLPGKVLVGIAGRPMIQWVYERACASTAQEVIIATDDLRVIQAAQLFGADATMTAATHASGTDRIAEVARARAWSDEDIIVNLQGDEPLMPPALIDQVAGVLESAPQAGIATLAAPVESLAELMDPNAVKVVMDARGRALYFSRAPIPWNRDGAPSGPASQSVFAGAWRHVGLYAYRVGALLRLAALGTGVLEAREKLEQLRALEQGLEIRVSGALQRPGPDVNAAADLERVSALLRR